MIKEIRYGGYSANPNEYVSEDGELAMAMNLIPESGGLRPVRKGKVIHEWSEGAKPLFIHSLSNYRHIIYEKGNVLYWADFDKENDITTNESKNKVLDFSKNEIIKGIVSIGNTIIITTNTRMHYALWRNSQYSYLGDRLPFIGIEFDVRKYAEFSSTETDLFENISRMLSNRILKIAGNPGSVVTNNPIEDKEALSKFTEAVYGQVLKLTSQKITSQGLFYQPFMVRYALRMYDDSYVMHSSPVLMLPTICTPSAKMKSAEVPEESKHILEIDTSVTVNAYSLVYRILHSGELKKWKDLIMGVDIFITTPMYVWNQSKDIDITCFGNLPCLSRGIYKINHDGTNIPDKIFAGHYDGEDKYIPFRQDDNYWQIPLNDKWENDVLSAHSFYHIAHISLDKIKTMSEFEDVSLNTKELSALATLPILKDDFNSHSRIIGDFQYVYNNRLNLSNVEYFPGDTLPIRTMGQYIKPSNDTYIPIKVDVWINKDDKEMVASQSIKQDTTIENQYAIASTPKSGVSLPRFLFYPDANAFKIKIKGDNMLKSYDLKPHDFLNGAYWWGGLDVDLPTAMTPIPNEEVSTTGIRISNKLYTSEAENPWVFTPDGIRSIGNGKIKGIATASKALSEGQFGAFPLYAFTTEGVWSLAVTSGGTFNPAQPITRDVCISADSITQIDQSVLFATDRGVMMIQGSDTISLTDKIDTDTPLDLTKQQGGETLIGLSGVNAESFDILPFKEFLQGSSMVYDYKNQRIILYNKECKYAYVYSFESKAWGMMESNIVDSINSYPDAMVVTDDNYLVNLSKEDKDKAKGLMITRALKLDGADILKTIDTLVQRGNFNRGDVSTILWGSRDLKNWHLVWSSKDHYLRGLRGTPYKYYRIGALTNLDEEEYLVGASVNYSVKQTNQLR